MSKTGLPLSFGTQARRPALFGFGLGLSFTLAPLSALAQTYEWKGGGADTNWSTAGNWNPATTPITNAAYKFSDYNGTVNQPVTVTVAVDRTVDTITYDSRQAYTINGTKTLTFGDTTAAGLPSITLNTGTGPQANHEINVPVIIAEQLTITNNSTDNLTFNGTITNTGGIVVDGTGGTSIESATYNGVGGIQKNGSGTLFLRKGNVSSSVADDIVVNAGILSAASQYAIYYNASTGNPVVQILSGASLEIDRPDGSAVSVTAAGNPDTAPIGGINISGNGVHYALQGDVGAIYAAPFVGKNTVSGNFIRLQGDTSFGAYNHSELDLNSVVMESVAGSDFIKVGQGTVTLNSTATYTGDTIVKEGLLSVNTSSTSGIPGGLTTPASNPKASRLILDGGVFGTAGNGSNVANALYRSVGTGANQVFWNGDGGFAAGAIGDMTVNLGGSSTTTGPTLTWGTGGFVPDGKALILGHEMDSGGAVNFKNPINLGSGSREIRAIKGVTALDSNDALTGVISGTGGIHKTGDGMLGLEGVNTYSGATIISDGALSLKQFFDINITGSINNSHIVLDGGVFMPPGATAGNATSASYAPTLGTGAGQVSWSGNGGGFASFGSQTTTVTLNNNATTALVWGSTANFLGNSDTLVLGSQFTRGTTTGTLILNNAINLNGGNRTVRIDDGAANTDATLSQNISGSGTLNFTGTGQVVLQAANTTTADINIKGADVWLQSKTTAPASDGSLNAAGNIKISQGGMLQVGHSIDNFPEVGRINDTSTVTLDSETLSIHAYVTDSDFTETIGNLVLAGGANDVTLEGNRTNLAAASLTRSGHGTVDFRPANVGTAAANAHATFTTVPTLTNGILPYATIDGGAFATYNTTTNSIDAITSTATANASWTSSINYGGGSQTLAASRTVNSLDITGGTTIGQSAASTLTVNSGGILTSMTSADTTISTAALKSATSELFLHAGDTSGTANSLTITSAIQDASGSLATTLVKTGNATVTLSGSTANTISGGAVVQEGTLILAKTTGPALSGDIIVGDRAGDEDVLQLNASNQFQAGTSLTLMGGDPTVAGSAIATLRFNGQPDATVATATASDANLSALDNTLSTLTVSMSGNLDFDGGTNDAPNYLHVSNVTFSDSASRLTVSNWREFKDYLLIPTSETADFASYASQIHFDGYEGTSTITRYDSNYWQITPLGSLTVPEPHATTAAVLAAAALLSRRRRIFARH